MIESLEEEGAAKENPEFSPNSSSNSQGEKIVDAVLDKLTEKLDKFEKKFKEKIDKKKKDRTGNDKTETKSDDKTETDGGTGSGYSLSEVASICGFILTILIGGVLEVVYYGRQKRRMREWLYEIAYRFLRHQ